jgi:hypothetical protein
VDELSGFTLRNTSEDGGGFSLLFQNDDAGRSVAVWVKRGPFVVRRARRRARQALRETLPVTEARERV